jgi:flagellin-like hook-associated protein FlgL
MPVWRTGENPVRPRTFNQLMGHAMSRLPTNTSAMTALAALTPTGKNLKGLANSTAAGKPAYLSIAKMNRNTGAFGVVNDVLSESKSLVSPMSPALNITISVIDAIKNNLVTASQPGAELNKIETDIANALTDVATAIGSITTAASTLDATTTNLPTQRTYVSNLSDSLTTGVGALVGANMNEAATKLAAPKVEQQLDAQALSISNSNTKLILKLFEL